MLVGFLFFWFLRCVLDLLLPKFQSRQFQWPSRQYGYLGHGPQKSIEKIRHHKEIFMHLCVNGIKIILTEIWRREVYLIAFSSFDSFGMFDAIYTNYLCMIFMQVSICIIYLDQLLHLYSFLSINVGVEAMHDVNNWE